MKNEATITDAWLRELRARFVEIARRRVPEDAVEDVVQDALTIIYRKRDRAPEVPPELAWSFQVLRNVIGNHYQRARTRYRAAEGAPSLDLHGGGRVDGVREPTPLESLERAETARLLHEAVDDLARNDPHCGQELRRVLGPMTADEASAAGVRDSTHYVRLFRCREKLRKILLQRGFQP